MKRLTSNAPLTEFEAMNMSVTNLYVRLKEYENTGLEPEEITDYLPMMKAWRQNMGALRHIRELVEIEAEDRLLILPCKVGDAVYCIRKNPFAKGPYVKENIAESITVYRDHSISILSTLNDVLGETVFLTREEAEAALRGGADG